MIPGQLDEIRILLASGSPRRQELLRSAGFKFRVVRPDDAEQFDPEMKPNEIVESLALRKCMIVYPKAEEGEMVLAADTIVVCDNRILNKPNDKEEAIEYLKLISNRSHKVITGVAIRYRERSSTFSTTTEVDFGNLRDDEMDHYVDNYKPFDKAGAYGIQEWIGMVGIKGIRGCYYNVMGLPLYDLYHKIREITE